MRGKEVPIAIACALLGAAVAYSARVALGSWPSPVIYYSLVVVGLGAALVTVRYGRLGPFEGELGAPSLETRVRDDILRESERAVRFAREFTIVAVRQTSGTPVLWTSAVRMVDDVVECRRGLLLLMLPETSSEGAVALLRRVRELYTATLEAAIVVCPEDGRTGDAIAAQLLTLIREARRPNEVVVRLNGSIEFLSLSV